MKKEKVFIDGRRNVTAAEFRKLGPTLNWTKQGSMLRDSGKSVAASTVMKQFEKYRTRKIYETAFGVVARFGEDSSWYEGTK